MNTKIEAIEQQMQQLQKQLEELKQQDSCNENKYPAKFSVCDKGYALDN